MSNTNNSPITIPLSQLASATGGGPYGDVLREDKRNLDNAVEDGRQAHARGDRWGKLKATGKVLGHGALLGFDAVVPGRALARAITGG